MLQELNKKTTEILGPADPLPHDIVTRVLDDKAEDRQIADLARQGITYVDIARYLGKPINHVLQRIVGMLNQEEVLTPPMINDYLRHQLEIINIGIQSSLDDMNREPETDNMTPAVAAKARHGGRMALAKFLQQQAAILGLLRERIDIYETKTITIAELRASDWDNL